jgi:GNAT superfamily N-acetyltransferase
VNIVELGAGDASEVMAAGELFDHPPKSDATARFLAEPGHHLLVAYEDAVPIGFISGVETIHPDKGTEIFLYEMGVAESHRRRGVGRALVERLAAIAVRWLLRHVGRDRRGQHRGPGDLRSHRSEARRQARGHPDVASAREVVVGGRARGTPPESRGYHRLRCSPAMRFG